MTRAISIGWTSLIGKCRFIFLRYSHWSLTGQFGIMESTLYLGQSLRLWLFHNMLAGMQLINVIFFIAKHVSKRCRIVSQHMTAARSSLVFFIFEIPDVNHATTRSAEKIENKNVTDKTRVSYQARRRLVAILGKQGPYAYTTATARTTPCEKCVYFTFEFLIYLELSSVSVGIKTCPCRICYEYV